MARQRAIRYVTQDGADFYIYRDSNLEDFQTTWTYKLRRVSMNDLKSAQVAREACIKALEFAGYEVRWPNPFGESN